MNKVWKTLLKGLSAVLPLGLTISLIYWLGRSTEMLIGGILERILPEGYYWPGLGLLAGLGILFAIGLFVNAWLIRKTLELTEHLLSRIPLVKSVYGSIRDFLNFFSRAQKQHDLENVVLVSVDGMELMGFTTQNPARIPAAEGDEEPRVAVYLPMSYQIGGYTVYVPRSRVRSLDISVEDAMRSILTAGLSTSRDKEDR